MLTDEDSRTTIGILQGFPDEFTATEPCAMVRGASDEELLQFAVAGERIVRCGEAFQVAVAAEIEERSRKTLEVSERLSSKRGCRSGTELLERLTGASAKTIAKRIRLGNQVRTQYGLDGMAFPAKFPGVAAGLASGLLGRDSAEVIIAALSPLRGRIAVNQIQLAEEALVAAATGQPIGPSDEATIPVAADETLLQAQVWRAFIDPDGLEPDEKRAMLNRGFRLGTERDGLIPVSAALMPETAAKFQRLMDAYMSPRTAQVKFLTAEEQEQQIDQDVLEHDDRTRDQLGHDLFTMIVDTAARSAEAPSIGGAAPTVLVSVRQEDFLAGTGAGHIDGQVVPVSMLTVEQIACAGGVQPVTINAKGKIIELGVTDRCFTSQQRRAITLRDGGCIIPGCQSPAAWAEIHHVIPDALGGPTEVGNGVTLCWFHHRTIHRSGWQIRMVEGVPQVKAPIWMDGRQRWHVATKSPTRMADQLADRSDQRDQRDQRDQSRTG